MKLIDLLNKIADGEEVPLKIKVKGYEYRQSNGQFWCDETEMYLIDNCTSIYHLNDTVEIIEEEKKIERIEMKIQTDKDTIYVSIPKKTMNKYVQDRIIEILDYIKSKGE